MTSAPESPDVKVLLAPGWARTHLIHDVKSGLGSTPRSLPPQWLYDDVGSDLFDQITRLAEYYPTECEREILKTHAGDIVRVTGATHVIELGSGTSDKTRTLLDAFARAGQLDTFTPLDVSEQTLRQAADMLSDRYPATQVTAIVGDFNVHLGDLPRAGDRLIAFLGGTIGNYSDPARRAFLEQVTQVLQPGEHLLIGVDLVKSIDRLVSAYNDAAGVTELFIRNCLTVLNRELMATFKQDNFEYVCFWDPARERIDMRLRSLVDHQVEVSGADLVLDLAEDEEIRVETSAKFRRESLRHELAAIGLVSVNEWTDQAGDFAVILARRG